MSSSITSIIVTKYWLDRTRKCHLHPLRLDGVIICLVKLEILEKRKFNHTRDLWKFTHLLDCMILYNCWKNSKVWKTSAFQCFNPISNINALLSQFSKCRKIHVFCRNFFCLNNCDRRFFFDKSLEWVQFVPDLKLIWNFVFIFLYFSDRTNNFLNMITYNWWSGQYLPIMLDLH